MTNGYADLNFVIDLAKPKSKVHIIAPPPQDDQIVREIAHVLEYQYKDKSKTLSHQVAAISDLTGISREAVLPALGLANRGTRHKPNTKLAAAGLSAPSDSVRAVAGDDLYYRAAFLMNSSRRIQASLDAGLPERKALKIESRYFKQHELARRARLLTAANVQKNANMFGPMLGWYLNPLLNNEAECIAANGHNFMASEGTVIGLPGSVHAGCGCKSGPPHEGAGMVNDALKGVVKISGAKKFRLKASA